VYYESTQYVYNAIEREKEIKDMNRSKKEVLVRTMNPTWKDMYNELIL
jgi:putative endonuclease